MAYRMTVVKNPGKKKTMAKKKASKRKTTKKKSTRKKTAKKRKTTSKKKSTKKKSTKKKSTKKKSTKRKTKKKKSTRKKTAKKKTTKRKTKKKSTKKKSTRKKTSKKKTSKKKSTKKKSTKKKASKKKPVKRKVAKKAVRRAKRSKLPKGTPKPRYTMDEAEGRLGFAGKKLSRSAQVGKRKRKKIPGLSSNARRMQLASQGYLQVNPHGAEIDPDVYVEMADNPIEKVPGFRGLYVAKPGPKDKVRRKALVVKTGKRDPTRYGKGTVKKRVTKSKEDELNRIRRAAGIPVRKKR